MSFLHSNLEARIARSENPARILDEVVLEMRQQLVSAKKAVCIAIADEKVLRYQLDRHLADAGAWEKRAMMAVRAGDDNLARAALSRKAQMDELVQGYGDQWADQKRAVDNLRAALSQLGARIDEAARQRTMLVARAARAQAQRTIAATMARLDHVSPWGTLERMEERVLQLEADTEAAAEMGDGADVALEAQFRALAAGSVDDELAALKRRMAIDGPRERRALPA
jgi:phage shock protein A